MTEGDNGKQYDDPDMERFFTENRDMIEKILAQERARAAAAAEDVRRETAARVAYERELAQQRLAEGSQRAYGDYQAGRGQAEEAFNEGRDHFRQFADEQTDYAYSAAREERERARRMAAEEREYLHIAAEEERARIREEAMRQKAYADEAAGKVLGVVTDPQFQQHLVGAGMEMFMALNALIRASPVPDSVKDAADRMDRNKNTEYCRKNPYCQKKTPAQQQKAADAAGLQRIEIASKSADTDAPGDAKKE